MHKLKYILFLSCFAFNFLHASVNNFDKGFAAFEKGKYDIAVDYYTS